MFPHIDSRDDCDLIAHNQSATTTTTICNSATITAKDELNGYTNETKTISSWGVWLKIQQKLSEMPFYQLRRMKWMNKRATSQTAYVPTEVSVQFLWYLSVWHFIKSLKKMFIN